MAELGIDIPLSLVTHNGTTVDCSMISAYAANPAQSLWWGVGRVLMNEHPDLSVRLIDLQWPVTQNQSDINPSELKQLATHLYQQLYYLHYHQLYK